MLTELRITKITNTKNNTKQTFTEIQNNKLKRICNRKKTEARNHNKQNKTDDFDTHAPTIKTNSENNQKRITGTR